MSVARAVQGAPSRVKGRPVVVRHLRRALVAAVRFDQWRAASPADRAWTAKAIDAIRAALTEAER